MVTILDDRAWARHGAAERDTSEERLRALVAARIPGHSLQQAFYTSPEVFSWDMDRVFRAYWLYAGHVSQLPRPGDYFLYRIGADSIIVMRGDDGRIYAHYNVCRHRGSHLLLEESGHAAKIVCPYHAWAYNRDGSLAACLHMPVDFDTSRYGLHRVHTRVAEGLIYINLAATPPDFQPFADDLAHFLGAFELAQAKLAHHARYEVPCNWKLLAENFCECYHCGPAHPEYCDKVMYAAATAHPKSISAADARAVEDDARAHFARIGLAAGHRDGPWYFCGRQALRPGHVSMSRDGQPVAPLLGRLRHPDAGNFAFFSRPTSICEASGDQVVLIRFTPMEAKRTRTDVYWLVRGDAEEGRDYEVDQLIWFWKTTAEQDWTICANNQAGVDSAAYRPGPYSLVEGGVEKYVLWYLDALTQAC